MEEVQKNTSEALSLSPDAIRELVDTKENLPTPPKKFRVLPRIIIILVIIFVLTGIGFLVWKLIQTSNAPDLTINAPTELSATPIPTPPDTTQPIINQDILFETNPYTNDKEGFEIKIPQGWHVDDSQQSGAVVVLTNPKATIASGSAYLTFVSVSTGSPASLDEAVQTSKSGLQKLFNSYLIEEDKQLTVSGFTYHLLGGSYMIKDVKIRNRNLILIYNKKGYAISATAPDSVWSQNELLLNATLFSFRNF